MSILSAYIPKPLNPEWYYIPERKNDAPPVVVHALKENKRPIGFASWPDEQDVPDVPKKAKRKKAAR